ncbi:MAG: response regulator, partial [Candidatus Obscuribacterales bacterium]|nr:response regulator [Candidatus Obscuribacterales bacterium]
MASILYVDDDVDLTWMVSIMLKEEGHSAEIVHTGTEGWEKAKANQYDLLLLDWDLPGLNGINILRRFREAGNNAPVIMMTAHTSPSDKELALDSGADDYVAKPFNHIELAARVRALLRRARTQQAAPAPAAAAPPPAPPKPNPLGSGNEAVLARADL